MIPKNIRLAILDMYDDTPNEGMRCIWEILYHYTRQLEWDTFNVRKGELPDTSYDIYISTGGPGNPMEGAGAWDRRYYMLLDQLWEHNQQRSDRPKFVFFICHSFQMACHHFGIGEIKERHSMSFGTFPVHMTAEGEQEPVFEGLSNPFWAADFRNYQVVQPNFEKIAALGAEILALEKIRKHVPYERAIMAVRFSPEFVGVQFHPEADSRGMLLYFLQDERRNHIIKHHSRKKYAEMIRDLSDPQKIAKTNQTILPKFLDQSISILQDCLVPVNA